MIDIENIFGHLLSSSKHIVKSDDVGINMVALLPVLL